MLKIFKSSPAYKRGKLKQRHFSVGPSRRIYAIGDIHGRMDLLTSMLRRIDLDDAERGSGCDTLIIFLGDLIDRGPQSADVVEKVLTYTQARSVVALAGNHEEVFSLALAGNLHALSFFLNIGGEQTLISYGVEEHLIAEGSLEAIHAAMIDAVPVHHQTFIQALPDYFECGEYLFVHAGIRPKVPLESQTPADLHWIREEFLSSPLQHSHMIIHGHTITPSIDERGNRIGVDTGAYQTGQLSAIALQGAERWFLSVDGTDDIGTCL